MRVAVIDSSPLINLAHLNLALELANFFDRVYVPRAVQRELNRKGRFRYKLNKLYATGIFERCAAADATNVQFLRAELDEGESEALIQAQERQAHAFIGDDRQARVIAERMGRKSVGTLRLLARLSLEGRAASVERLVAVCAKIWISGSPTNSSGRQSKRLPSQSDIQEPSYHRKGDCLNV